MAAPPLTHHDILALVAPFVRHRRLVDLGACDRIERRVVFKPIQHTAHAPDLPERCETVLLDKLGTDSFRLTRELLLTNGLKASLDILGSEPEVLLMQMEAVPHLQHFRAGEGFLVVRDYAIRLPDGANLALPLRLTEAVVQVPGLTLTMRLPATAGISANIELLARDGATLNLPDDLLAVLGWNWSRLVRQTTGWHARLRIRGRNAQRTLRAEQALDRVAAHLAFTLRAAPGQFHDLHVLARWRAALRRAIPILTPICTFIGVLVLPVFEFREHPGMWIVLSQIPTALIALSFTTQDLARFEIPPWPRRSSAAHWQTAQAIGTPKI
jgi:hypothetical protein